MRKHLQGFTLVELIVVVTVIAILSAIGLVSFSWYSSGARDSTRVEDMTNIQKALAISATTSVNGKYPLPDGGVSILNNGSLVNTQGYAGKSVLNAVKFNGAGMDPLDSQYYTYTVNASQTGTALVAFLENSSSLTLVSYLPSLPRASAAATVDYSMRYPAVKGAPVGVLIANGTNQPLQASGTGLDIAKNVTVLYTAYMAPKVAITAMGTTLMTAMMTAGSGMTNSGTVVVSGPCNGLPANAVYYGSASSYSLTNAPFGSTSFTAAFAASGATANTCQFTCASGYNWNGSACLLATVNGACTGLPSNAVYYGSVTSYTLSGAAAGTPFAAAYTGGTLIPNSCQFNCASGYAWNGSSCAVIAAHNYIYVANSGDNTVSVINGASNAVVATIPVGTTPKGVAYNPTNNKVYVTNTTTTSVIDPNTNTVVTTIPSAGGCDVVVNPNTNKIYVANGGLTIIDGATNTVVGSASSGGQHCMLSINPTTNMIYGGNGNYLQIINGNDNTVTQPGIWAIGQGVNPSTNLVYAMNWWGSAIDVYNGSTLAAIVTVGGIGFRPGGSIAVNTATNMIYSPGGPWFYVVNGATNAVVASFPSLATSGYYGVNQTTNKVYIPGSPNSVSVLDGASNTITATITVGSGPIGVAIVP